MPRVPTYDGPQVASAPLRAPNLDTVDSPELRAGTAQVRQTAAFGQSTLAAGIKTFETMQERENADMLFRAETALKDDYIKQEQDWRQNRQGRFAKSLTADAAKWFDDTIQKHSETLGNDQQKRMFRMRATSLRESSLHSVSSYETAQLERSHDEAWKADKNVTISTAAQTPTADNIEKARAELDRLNRYQAARKGWDGATLQNEALQDTTTLHENVIKGMARTDPAGAQVYFNKFKSEIDGKRHDEIGKFAESVSANAIGDQTAEAIWGKHGPKADADPINLDELEKKAREALTGNEPARKAAIAALRERTVAFDKGVKEREAANASAVAQADMSGQSLSAIRAMPEFQAMSGTKQAAMIEHIENSRYTRAQRGRQATEQAEQDLARRNASAYLAYSDPAVLKDMSRNQVQALLPDLGRTYTEHLLGKWDSIEKGGAKVTEARMDQDDFNHVAQVVGLKPFDPKKTEDERAALGELKYRIEQRIDQEQAKKKAPLTRAEKMTVMQQEMDNKVLVDRTLWWDASKPTILLTPDERAKAYVIVGTQKVKLADIPEADRRTIADGMHKRGIPVSEEGIARVWLKAGGKRVSSEEAAPPAAIAAAAALVGGSVPEEQTGPRDQPFVSNAGRAFASGVALNPNIAGWGIAQAGAEIISDLVTGPLARARILPEDVAARMAKTFADMRHDMQGKRSDWMPRAGRDFAVPAPVPKPARVAIEQLLEKAGVPATEDTVRQVYRGFLEHQRLQERPGPGASDVNSYGG